MGRHIVIIGGLASGKTTLAKYLEEVYGYTRIVTYTTRPIRQGETEGKDYYFVNEEKFNELDSADFFFETTYYDTVDGRWFYGSQRDACTSYGKTVIILNPHGALIYKEPALLVWLDLPLQIRMQRALTRGDDPLEVARRVLADENDFGSEELAKTSGIRIKEIVALPELAEHIDGEAKATEDYKAFLQWKEGDK